MAYTFSDLITRTQRRLAQVSGTAVQTYSEDVLAEMMNHKFEAVLDELWWSDYMYYTTITLDGVTGTASADLHNITDESGADIGLKRFEDIKNLWWDDNTEPMIRLPNNINPTRVTGTNRPRYYEPYAVNRNKYFRVLPLTSDGEIVMHYRSKPELFTADDMVYMDAQVLITGTAYDYLEDDGSNPGAVEKARIQFESRLNQMRNLYSDDRLALNQSRQGSLSEWTIQA